MAKIKIENQKKVILVGSLAVILIILAVVFYSGGDREKIKNLAETGPQKPPSSTDEPAGLKTITLFFLSDGDDLLHREEREIAAGPTEAEEAERAVTELVKGSEHNLISPLPAETKVRQVFVTETGIAYVDFSRDIMDKSSYGSSSELAAVFSVVNSLAYNFKSVKKVAILVEGGERETLGGHVDLTKAFGPDYSMIAK